MNQQVGEVVANWLKPAELVNQGIGQPREWLITHRIAGVAEHPVQPRPIQALDMGVLINADAIVPLDEVSEHYAAEDPERREE